MKCTPIALGEGITAIVCSRHERRRCSTVGCHSNATLQCDHPVKREPGTPKRGDTRLHRASGVTFYVRAVDEVRREVTISRAARSASFQVVSFADWHAKSDATCDRAICSACAVRVGANLHYCPPHAREMQKREQESA